MEHFLNAGLIFLVLVFLWLFVRSHREDMRRCYCRYYKGVRRKEDLPPPTLKEVKYGVKAFPYHCIYCGGVVGILRCHPSRKDYYGDGERHDFCHNTRHGKAKPEWLRYVA